MHTCILSCRSWQNKSNKLCFIFFWALDIILQIIDYLSRFINTTNLPFKKFWIFLSLLTNFDRSPTVNGGGAWLGRGTKMFNTLWGTHLTGRRRQMRWQAWPVVTMAGGGAWPMMMGCCKLREWKWRGGEVPWTTVKLTVCSARAEAAHGSKFVGEVGELMVVAGRLTRSTRRWWAMIEIACAKDWVWHYEAHRAMELDREGLEAAVRRWGRGRSPGPKRQCCARA